MRVFNVVFDYTQSRLRFSVGNESLGSISKDFELYTPTEEKADLDTWDWVGISIGVLVIIALICLVYCTKKQGSKAKQRQLVRTAKLNQERDYYNLNHTQDDDIDAASNKQIPIR